jgi:hypothetical protein
MKGSKFVAVDFTKVMLRILRQINRASLCWDYLRGNRTFEDILKLNMYPEIRYEMNSRVLEKKISENPRLEFSTR